MADAFQTVLGLIGGLALFLFGMNLMSESLQKVAGERMRKVLALLTKNPLLGVIAGCLCTAVLQSSSATTVMAIGFVSAGLMGLPQAISIILGANIGTTITAQIIAFKISDYVLLFVFVGFLLSFVARRERTKNIGLTVFAFGVLFLGIDTMGGAMKPLASSEVFVNLIGQVANVPVLGVLVGTLMTLVVQSSSATIAVLQNLAAQAGPDGVTSVIGLSGAIPLLLGDNIGTTITALLASIGQSRNAKRVALSHCLFNISGCLLFIWFVNPYAEFIQLISPEGPEVEVISRQIANAHTCFNLAMTIIWMPLIPLMVRLVMLVLPHKALERGDGHPSLALPAYLDAKLIGQPSVALQLTAQEIVRHAQIVQGVMGELCHAAQRRDTGQLRAVEERAQEARGLRHEINDYLAELFSAGVLTEEQATKTTGLMRTLNDVGRVNMLVGDIAVNLQRNSYSKKAVKSLCGALGQLEAMYADALQAIEDADPETAELVLKRRNDTLTLDEDLRKAHMRRVAKGECKPGHSEAFNDILFDIYRMGNSCVNLAEAGAGKVDFAYFMTVEEETVED